MTSSQPPKSTATPGTQSVISTNSVATDGSLAQPAGKSSEATGSRFATLPAEFGRYRIDKLLGQGAMGAVYRAEDRQLGRQVALKIPRFDQDHSGELLTRFYREARSAGMLRHPNICPVYDVGEIDGQHYITMAYIAGRTLSDILRSDKPPGERQAVLIVRKLALALQDAHAQGIIHRDLKPGNVMIDARGEPIVMDFGLACQLQQDDAARITQSGMIVGSPAYMSPEQIEGRPEKLTPAADQYALGVMLYELLTGQLPFRGNITSVISQIVTRPPQPPRELRPMIDPRVESICLRMLSKSATERYPSLKSVADVLMTVLRDPKSGSATASTPAITSGAVAPATTPNPVGPTMTQTASAESTSIDDRRRQIQSWLTDGNFAAAKPALTELASINDLRALEVTGWAKQQLAQLDAEAARWQAAKKQQECAALLKSIEDAVRQQTAKGLPTLIQRYLKLQPDHAGLKAFAADIQQLGIEAALRSRKNDVQYLQSAATPWPPRPLIYIGGGIAAVVVVVVVLTVFVLRPAGSKTGTVAIDVGDPFLTVKFADDVVKFETSGKTFSVPSSARSPLEIEHDGRLYVSPPVTVSRGGHVQAVVTVQDGRPALTLDGQFQELTTTSRGNATPASGSSTVAGLEQQSIPADAVTFNGHAYKFYPERLSWTAAQRRCEQLGGHLPTISDATENQFVLTTAQRAYPTSETKPLKAIWLGLSDAATEGRFVWSTGESATYRNWAPNQPNGKTPAEDYATMTVSAPQMPAGAWSDQPDDSAEQAVYLICEWDGLPENSIGSGTDFLASVDLATINSVNQRWVRNGRELTGRLGTLQSQGWVGLKSPSDITGDYDLECEFLTESCEAIEIELPLKKASLSVMLSLTESGLQWTNAGAFLGQPSPFRLQPGVPIRVVAAVRHAGNEVAVAVTANGEMVGRYTGPPMSSWKTPPEQRVKLSAHLTENKSQSRIEIHRSRVRLATAASVQAMAPVQTGFVDLLNSSDLAGWSIRQSYSDPNDPSRFPTHLSSSGGWQNRQGTLVCATSQSGWLRSQREYDNFALQLEYKLPPDGNSGILIRTPQTGHLSDVGMEIQIIDENRLGLAPSLTNRTGAIFGVAAAARAAANPVGQWNTLEVTCQGDLVTIRINQQLVNEVNMALTPALTSRPRRGYLGIYNWRGEAMGCEFRNIRIRELPPS
jgi:serine/threonine protein kinase